MWFSTASSQHGDTPAFSDLVQKVTSGQVEQRHHQLPPPATSQGNYKNGDEFRSTIPPNYNDFYTTLLNNNVQVKHRKGQRRQVGYRSW